MNNSHCPFWAKDAIKLNQRLDEATDGISANDMCAQNGAFVVGDIKIVRSLVADESAQLSKQTSIV